MSDLYKYIDQWEKYQKELAANGEVSYENEQEDQEDEYDFLDDSNLMLTEEEKKNPELVTNKVINHYWNSLHEKIVNESNVVAPKDNSLNEVKKNIKKDADKRAVSDNPVNLDAMGADQDSDAIYKNDGGPHYDPTLLDKLAKLKTKLYDLESDFNAKTTDEVAKAKLDKIQKNIDSLKKQIEDLSV